MLALSFVQEIVLGFLLALFSMPVAWLLDWWISRSKHRSSYHRPIICVCEVNGRMGVVLRRDYNEASRQYWKQYYDGKHYDAGHVVAPEGRRLQVEPLFNFKAWSPEYYTICFGCYVERAIFDVPAVLKDESGQIAEAHQYFHGKPWNGQLISW
jgi:hypothetical protein